MSRAYGYYEGAKAYYSHRKNPFRAGSEQAAGFDEGLAAEAAMVARHQEQAEKWRLERDTKAARHRPQG